MQPDKKQKQQFIILGVVAVLFVGFVSFQFMGASQTSPTSRKATASDAQKTPSDTGQAADAQVMAPVEFPKIAVPLARRDPFLPQVEVSLDSDANNVAGQQPQVSPSPRISRMPSIANGASLPSIRVRPMNPFGAGSLPSAGSAQSAPAQVEVDPVFTVTGVVRGADNVAIIRDGQTGRHIIREGQLIDGKYRLQSVHSDGVVLIYKGKVIRVKLGGGKNAS